MNRVFAIVISVCSLAISRADDAKYPRAELLIEPAELAKLNGVGVIILDARAATKYKAGHIPDARWVDHGQWAKAFGHGTDAKGWGARIGGLGINADSHVVVTDDNSTKDSARIWLILRYWGVDNVRLLNGGWTGWESGKYATTTDEPTPKEIAFAPKVRADRLTTKDQLLESLRTKGSLQIVDARSEKEFCGDEKMNNKRAGAIPGAKQLEWSDLLDKPTQRFKTATQLKSLFADAGIALDKPSTAHCQSGGRASVMVFAMELMGAKSVGNYYQSWTEWGNADDTPVVPGKPKK